jgi:hypothetical protein
VYQDPHLLVARPIEPHFGCCSSNAAIHFGDGNGSLRLPLDLVEQPAWDARGEGEHDARVAQ